VDRAVIAARLAPFAELRSELLGQTLTYVELLQKWNSKVNLTAVRQPEEMVTRHFGESFFAAKMLLQLSAHVTVIDVGSGAGFPGLPLAMFAPEARVTLIEADGRKAAFLNEVIRALGLANAKVFSRRAETFADTADLVIMRAVERFEKTLSVAWDLVAEGGRIALMIGDSQLAGTKSLPGKVEWMEPVAIPGGRSRVMLVGTRLVQGSNR
jgi:16S rRNA (guanine527-N7)-methyltransferase